MSTIGKSITVKGELRSGDDITIEGRVDGYLFCETGCVVLAAGGEVHGDVVARDITVFGRHTGQLVATDVVDIRADAAVDGQIISRRFILDPQAQFKGRVEPQHVEAAVLVARFHQRKRENGAEPPPRPRA